MKKIIFSALALITLLAACSKHGTVTPDNNSTGTDIKASNFMMDTTTLYPSSMAIITSSSLITRDTLTVNITGKQVLMAKIDNYRYAFNVPLLPTGKYTVDLTALNASVNPQFTIGTYAAITNPVNVVNAFTSNFTNLLTSLQSNNFKSALSSDDILFANQLLQQFQKQFSTLTDAQKMTVAYMVQQMGIDIPAGTSSLDSKFTLSAVSTSADDVGASQLQNKADAATARNIKTKKALLAFEASFALALITPPPADLLFALGAFSSAVYYCGSSDVEKVEVKEAENTAAVAVSFSTASTTITTSKVGSSLLQIVSGVFRPVNTSDNTAAAPLAQEEFKAISDAATDDQEFVGKFSEFKGSKFSNLLSDITSVLTPISNAITQIPTTLTAAFKSKNLLVKNSSNADIIVSATDDGANGLNITASNPAGNITASTNYDIEIDYPQPELGNTAKVIQHATYNPSLITIGAMYAGGIVYYLDASGQHGLVVSPSDLGKAAWDTNVNDYILRYGTTPDAFNSINTKYVAVNDTTIGAGAANTAKIIAALGAGAEAANLCRSYNGGGYTDWFLPSLGEVRLLNNLYMFAKTQSKDTFNITWSVNYQCSNDQQFPATTFTNSAGIKITASESICDHAIPYSYPVNPTSGGDTKILPYNVRAVRKF